MVFLCVFTYVHRVALAGDEGGREGGKVTADGWTVHGTPVLVCFDANTYVSLSTWCSACVCTPVGRGLQLFVTYLQISCTSLMLPLPPLALPFSLHSFPYKPSCLSTMTQSQLWHSGTTLSSVHVASPSNCGAWRTAE